MSQRLASETMRRAFSKPWAAVTLPGTTVSARTSNSGEFSASMIAMASSVPGSVSMITLRGAAPANEPSKPIAKTARPFQPTRDIPQLPLPKICVILAMPLPSARHNDQRQANQEASEHCAYQGVGSLRRAAEFFPDEDAPERGDHRGALAE